MYKHTAILFNDKTIVIEDNTFYKLYNGIHVRHGRTSTPKSAMGYLNSKIKRALKISKNSRSTNLYTKLHYLSNGRPIREDNIQFIDINTTRGIYSTSDLTFDACNKITPEQKPVVVFDGSNTDIEITYDGKTFVGDIKVVIEVITSIHNAK